MSAMSQTISFFRKTPMAIPTIANRLECQKFHLINPLHFQILSMGFKTVILGAIRGLSKNYAESIDQCQTRLQNLLINFGAKVQDEFQNLLLRGILTRALNPLPMQRINILSTHVVTNQTSNPGQKCLGACCSRSAWLFRPVSRYLAWHYLSWCAIFEN